MTKYGKLFSPLFSSFQMTKYLNLTKSKTELLQLITSNVYSILYLPSLKPGLKQKIISVSAKAIKICMFYPDPIVGEFHL